MSVASEDVVQRGLRQGLLALMAMTGIGTSLELLLTNHMESPPQLVPFVVMGIGLAVAVAVAVAPSKRTIGVMRVVAVLLVLAGAFGVFEHLEHNYAFEAEIRPTEGAADLIVHAIFGANPALAPGAVALMGLLGALATWRHPSA